MNTINTNFRDAKKAATATKARPSQSSLSFVHSAIDANGQPPDAKVANLARAVDHSRKGKQPTNPTANNKKFAIDEEYIPPNFYRGYVEVDSERHLFFATDKQLGKTAKIKRIFIDGSFTLPSLPFIQLFTISGFLQFQGT